MLRRTLALLFLSLPLLAASAGCDTRPKVVMPASPVPPASKPRSMGGGSGAAQPATPDSKGQAPASPLPGEKGKTP